MKRGFSEQRFELGGKYLSDDLTEGHFTNDPAELVEKFGGRWPTTNCQADDVIIFNRYLLHAGPTNCTDRFRFSVDTRYQPASHPADDRWIGGKPEMHMAFWKPGAQLASVEDSRQRWNV